MLAYLLYVFPASGDFGRILTIGIPGFQPGGLLGEGGPSPFRFLENTAVLSKWCCGLVVVTNQETPRSFPAPQVPAPQPERQPQAVLPTAEEALAQHVTRRTPWDSSLIFSVRAPPSAVLLSEERSELGNSARISVSLLCSRKATV